MKRRLALNDYRVFVCSLIGKKPINWQHNTLRISILNISIMPRTKTPDYARLDDIDVYIQSIPRSPEEEKRLRDLLRKEMEKSHARHTPSRRSAPASRKQR